MQLSPALENIGLTRSESEVYIALLRIGRTTAGPIIRNTGLHRQIVYTALERLEDRGLVSHVLQNNRKRFSAIPPDDLLRKEMERFRSFTAVIPELRSIQRKASDQLHVETFVGPNELFQALLSAVDSAGRTDGYLRIMGGERATQLYSFMGSRYADYVRYTADKKVTKRLITSPANLAQYQERFLTEPRAQLRVHEAGFSMPSASLVTQELLDLYVIGDDVVVLRIWNRTIAKSYVEHFQLLWTLGTELSRTKGKSARAQQKSARGKRKSTRI